MPESATNDLSTFPIGPLRYTAGVYHADIRSFVDTYHLISPLKELAADRGGLSEIELASKCIEESLHVLIDMKKSCPHAKQATLFVSTCS